MEGLGPPSPFLRLSTKPVGTSICGFCLKRRFYQGHFLPKKKLQNRDPPLFFILKLCNFLQGTVFKHA